MCLGLFRRAFFEVSLLGVWGKVFPQKAKNPQGLLGNRGIVGLLESILRLSRAKHEVRAKVEEAKPWGCRAKGRTIKSIWPAIFFNSLPLNAFEISW